MPVPVALELRVFMFLLFAVAKGGSQEASGVRLSWCLPVVGLAFSTQEGLPPLC